MGIKMKTAMHKVTKEKIDIENANDEMRKTKVLKCETESCSANLTWAKSYKRNDEIETKYYRLLPNEVHSLNCIYNLEKIVEFIAKKADKNILTNLKNKSYEFRLNILKEDLVKYEKEMKKHVKLLNDKKTTEKTSIKLIKRGEKSPYLSLAKDIIKLRAELEKNEEIEKYLKLNYNNQKLSWDDFYYEYSLEEKLYKYILKNGSNGNNGKTYLPHPICFEGTLKNDIRNNFNKNNIFNISFIAKKRSIENKTIIYKIRLSTTNVNIISILEEAFFNKDKIDAAIYFIPEIANDYYENKKENLIIWTVYGWINNEDQIELL